MEKLTPAQKAAATRQANKDARRPSAVRFCKIEGEGVVFEHDGLTTRGLLSDVNALLEKLGFKPLRVTQNMLNPSAGKFLIDADTPSYCDPGREAYHSM